MIPRQYFVKCATIETVLALGDERIFLNKLVEVEVEGRVRSRIKSIHKYPCKCLGLYLKDQDVTLVVDICENHVRSGIEFSGSRVPVRFLEEEEEEEEEEKGE